MSEQLDTSRRKRPGPPATGKGTLVGVRLQPEPLRVVDHWAATQDDRPSRPEALRRLAELGLKEQVEAGHRRLDGIRTHKDVFVGELAEHGEWVVANVEPSLWPVNAQKVVYRGHAFWIIPVMTDFYPAVAMRMPPGKSRAYCERLVMRFISNLSWVEDRGIMVDGIGGGNLPRPMGRQSGPLGFAICDEFDLSYFPEPTNDEALLALALMREGRGLNHPAYAFLSFFRVLEVAFPNGRRRQAWIEANVANVDDSGVKEALDRLAKAGITDVGTHLLESGRCAVAHASRQPIADPDNPDDMRRLWSELPIMMALARKAIEDELGVETSQTVYEKHLYELAGFKEILGPEIVDFLTRGEQITECKLKIPAISVRILRREPYGPLSNLLCKEVGQEGKLFHMRFESKEGDVSFGFALDFGNERLEFSLFSDIGVKDLGTAESAERIGEVQRFQHDYFGNGQLHIVNAETGVLIGRKDAYMPTNMFLDRKAADSEIEGWKALAERRREHGRYADEMARDSRRYDVKGMPSGSG